jgi:hypothetical protein
LAALVVLLLLAGCSGPAQRSVAPVSSEAGIGYVPPQFSEETGGIDGLVVADDITPVAGATVALVSLDAITHTDDAGRFSSSLLAPGDYLVASNATGFEARAAKVFVQAGRAAEVHLTLARSAVVEPFTLVLIKNGILSCAPAAVMLQSTAACNTLLGGAARYNQSTFFFEVPRQWSHALTETTWPTKDFLAQDFYAKKSWASTKHDPIFSKVGKPVLRGDVDPGQKSHGTTLSTATYVPVSAFILELTSGYAGQYADEVNGTAYPVCDAVSGQACVGVGLAMDLRFSIYTSVFVNGRPTDLQHYTALPDQ